MIGEGCCGGLTEMGVDSFGVNERTQDNGGSVKPDFFFFFFSPRLSHLYHKYGFFFSALSNFPVKR